MTYRIHHPLGFLIAALLLGAAGTAAGQEAEQLNTLKSRFYTVHTPLSRSAVKPWARQMDVIFHHFRKRFSQFEKRGDRPISLYLFRTRQQYLQFMNQYDGVNAKSTGGMFFVLPKYRVRGLATWIQGRPKKRIREVLKHEGFHQFVFNYIGHNIPQWVNEGLAQYFQDARINGRKIKLGLVSKRRLRVLRQAYRQDALLPLNRVVKMSMKKWNALLNSNGSTATRMYAQSWSMVYFLIHAQDGRYREPFRRYLHELAKGRSKRQAAKAAFKVNDFGPMDRQWRRYLENHLFTREGTR